MINYNNYTYEENHDFDDYYKYSQNLYSNLLSEDNFNFQNNEKEKTEAEENGLNNVNSNKFIIEIEEENNNENIANTNDTTKNKEIKSELEPEKEKKIFLTPKDDALDNLNDLNKLKEEKTPALKKKRGRERIKNKSGEHTKFSDDNLRRKIKHIVLENTRKFINHKIEEMYEKKGKGILMKQLLIINQSQIFNATIGFNKSFLYKPLGEIFSDKISSRYTSYLPIHNSRLINELINDKNEQKKNYFTNLFNIKFIDCLQHFRGSKFIQELEGLVAFQDLGLKSEMDEEYWENLNCYIMNYELIISNKRERNKNE